LIASSNIAPEQIDKVLCTGKRLGFEGGIMRHSPDEIKSGVQKGFKSMAIGADYDYPIWGADIALEAAGREWVTDYAC
jgi:hypothetical protein